MCFARLDRGDSAGICGKGVDGWRWSGHTHPGDGINVKMPSPGDYAVLRAFGQRYSVILDVSGKYAVFGGDLDE